MKFLIDMPLSPGLSRWLVEQGHDAVHAQSVGLDRAGDSEIIEQARSESRTVVTADLDYPRLLALSGATEPSLILFRGGNWSERDVVERMIRNPPDKFVVGCIRRSRNAPRTSRRCNTLSLLHPTELLRNYGTDHPDLV